MTLEKQVVKVIPNRFIYEMDEGNPIYYKGTQAIISGASKNNEPMPDSLFQSWLKGKVYFFLSLLMMESSKYELTVGEQGLSLKKNLWRAVDVAIFKKENFSLSNNYSKKPPEVAFEIDLKGEFDTPEKILKDHKRKIKQLFDFGVKRIIWIYTDAQIVKVITPKKSELFEWDKDISVIEDYTINIQKIIEKYQKP